MKKIVIVAGDHSGDIYGGLLAEELKRSCPDIEIYSCGGENLKQYSIQLIDLISHAVMGLVEVLSSLGKLIKLFNDTAAAIDKIKPDLVITIDSPDFNLRLIKKLNKKYPVFYYVSPQVWAWRKGRIKQIKQYVDKMVVLFKFEQDFYQQHNINALYFGHPLLDIINRQETDVKNIISFMPGSRKSEIIRHMPVVIQTKQLLAQKLNCDFQIIRPHNISKDFYKQFGGDIKIIERDIKLLQESKFILCASGTATLELAIMNIPHLIFYKVNSLTWFLAKRLVKLDFVGIINILSRKKIVNEFLQHDATAQKMADYTLKILQDDKAYAALKEEMATACKKLEPFGATQSFAQYIKSYLSL